MSQPARARAHRLLRMLGLLGACGLAACAKRAPPTGGPPDIEQPRVVGWVPDSGAARVARDAEIALTFSEGMDPRTTAEAISLAPRVEIRERRWKGRTLILTPAESLQADQAYTVFLGAGARDRHGNPVQGRATVVFTTADSLPAGVIDGIVEAHGFSAPGTYLWCYDATGDRAPDSTARDFDAIGLADPDGHFRVVGLPVPGRYRLWVFADLNGNRSLEPDKDILTAIDTVFALTDAEPAATGFTVTVVNPRAPGRVRGTVLDSLRIERGALSVMAIADEDSLRRVLVGVDQEAHFEVSLPTGTWRLRAWRDFDRNRTWQRESEPASPLREVKIEAGRDVLDVVLVLERPPAGP